MRVSLCIPCAPAEPEESTEYPGIGIKVVLCDLCPLHHGNKETKDKKWWTGQGESWILTHW